MNENNHMVNKQGEVDPSEVRDVMGRISNERSEEILQNFNQFVSYLNERIELGEKLGLSEEQLAVTAEKIAGYLAEHKEPKNREEYLLRELWNAGNKEQQHQLSHMLVNMVKNKG
ncbi:DUF3243 domain-containing protein [Metabacillus sp. GX 13764]|uniref:DUF3243 domain-containing protein n=1 Tax=Metabacillus kandeliae TaxID=2900151 RepID=UPI001E5C5D8D|nr:DUF3243 domain-containing protein [Metabacillus kandeliae]MCD7035777.1 DUF3243 domain-containing protein [Metabacillus kandeliae]